MSEQVQKKVSAVHEGHAPTTVTRLHRYDYSGLESFLQAEAAWDPTVLAEAVGHDQAKTLKQMQSNYLRMQKLGYENAKHNINQFHESQKELKIRWEEGLKQMKENMAKTPMGGLGIQFAEKIQELPFFAGNPLFKKEKKGFAQVSAAQMKELREHKDFHASTEAEVIANAELKELRDETINKNKVQYNSKGKDFHITQLSNLYNSQYVGPIGVGTVKKPSGCVLPAGHEVKFFSNLDGKTSDQEKKSCHLEEESQVWVVFDTGSTNLWLASDLCDQAPCTNTGRHRFSHLKSATFNDPPIPVNLDITFGTGELKGPQAIDDIHVGPFTVRQQTFGMIQNEIGSVFSEIPFEGILGLAFPAMSANGVSPFFDNVVTQKVMKKNEFAFYFNADDKAGNGIFWGGVDPNFYEGDIHMFPVSIPYYWAVDLHKFMIGDQVIQVGKSNPMNLFQSNPMNPFRQLLKSAAIPTAEKKPQLIVDSGTTYFTAETGVYEKIMAHIRPANCKKITDATHPPLVYQVRDMAGDIREFKIPADEYMVADENGGTCEPAFMKIDIPKKYGPGMILGEVFMRNYFTVFDRGDGKPGSAKIGFARSKKGNEPESALRKFTSGQETFKQSHHGAILAEVAEKNSELNSGKYHHKPGQQEGSSEIEIQGSFVQVSGGKRFKMNPFRK